jgi:RNA polymerase sigma factor (sigma-70 family)
VIKVGKRQAEPANGPLDAKVATAFRGGDADAFDALYRRYAAAIHDYLRGTVRDPSLAEDLTQSTFLQAWERRASLREPSAVRSWLFRIAHNLAMNHVTRTPHADELSEDAEIATGAPGPEELAQQSEAGRLVWDAAASLESRQFAVLDLSVRKGLTTAEVAEVLGLDAAAASLAVFRAREALGNAVRYLLVARRRHHCSRLAELVPEGLRRLTPEQRASVDRHMRRCDVCQRTARMLAAPESLLVAIPVVGLPEAILEPPPVPHGSSGVPAARGVLRSAPSPGAAGLGLFVVSLIAITVGVLVVAGRGQLSRPAAPSAGLTSAATTGASAAGATSNQSPSLRASAPPSGLPDGGFVAGTGLPEDAYFTGVACPTDTRCVASATSKRGGVISISTDAGRTWQSTTVAGADTADSIACPTADACIFVGHAGSDRHAVFFTSRDGGANWLASARVPKGVTVDLVRCPDADDCLAVGFGWQKDPSVLRSTDGGETWSAGAAPKDAYGPGYLGGARCPDATQCWAVGSGIWFSSDLGATWKSLSPAPPTCEPGDTICGGPLHTLTDIGFMSANEILVVGGVPGGGYGMTERASYVGATTGGGATWQDVPRHQYPFPWVAQIGCSGSSCLAVSETLSSSEVAVSTDGARTWRQVQQAPTFLNALACSPDGRLCVLAGGKGWTAALMVAGGT